MSLEKFDTLPDPKDLIVGRVYRLRSRNLKIGIYDGDMGFIGIRTKFGNRFLFTEYHWDAEYFGTVADAIDLEIDISLDIDDDEMFNLLEKIENENDFELRWVSYK